MSVYDYCKTGNLKSLKKLSRGGGSILFIAPRWPDEDGWTPMMHGCYFGHLHIVKFLFQYGARDDVRRPDNNGRTPMWFACWKGHSNIVQYLFQNGARDQIRRPNNIGRTPMFAACREGH